MHSVYRRKIIYIFMILKHINWKTYLCQYIFTLYLLHYNICQKHIFPTFNILLLLSGCSKVILYHFLSQLLYKKIKLIFFLFRVFIGLLHFTSTFIRILFCMRFQYFAIASTFSWSCYKNLFCMRIPVLIRITSLMFAFDFALAIW